MAPFCTDCGTEARLVLGHEIGLHEPDLEYARLWTCDACPDAWCRHDPIAESPIGAPGGPDTRNARAMLAERQVERIVAEALRGCTGAREIAERRIVAFIAACLGLPPEDAEIGGLSIEQCREAWHALHGASYADVIHHAQRFRGAKSREAA